ncbi:MAG: adenine phosphoribosyltransferase [Porticoccaceae bacterium]
MPIKSHIRTIPHHPKPGVMFRDITTLLKDATAFNLTINRLADRYREAPVDLVAGIEARGFILGSALAFALGKGFVPIRKKGKLPGRTLSAQYALEYGVDSIEIHVDAIEAGQRVLLVDDLIATGGTALGAVHLVEQSAGVIHECCFIVDLPDLGGMARVKERGLACFALTTFDGE